MSGITREEFIQRSHRDFEFFSRNSLKILNKAGKLVPLILNTQQLEVHRRIEQQLQETGKVRVIILKSRRLGISTFVAGRFIWKARFNKYQRSGVMTHLASSTSALFKIYKLMHKHLHPWLETKLGASNSRELLLTGAESSIAVSTAGSAQTGRGDTLQRGHLSECAFFPNDREIAAGYIEAISNTPDSEIIIESTSNNIGNYFYDMWVDAEQGRSEFICIFLPWMSDPDCATLPPEDFKLDDDEREYKELMGLTMAQVYWRRLKILSLGDDRFRREYPATVAEAFRTSAGKEFIDATAVLQARKRNLDINPSMPLVLGVDVARYGTDRTCIAWRRGRIVLKTLKLSKMSGQDIADILIPIIQKDKPLKVYIDGTGGYGGAVVDCLRMIGYDSTEINFSSAPINKEDFFNRRAEMYHRLKVWLPDGQLPDEDDIEQDLTGFSFTHRNNKLLLEDKEAVKKRLKRSPDTGDAIALTFAEELGSSMNTVANNSNWQQVINREPVYAW